MSKWAKTTIELETLTALAMLPPSQTSAITRRISCDYLFRLLSYRRHDRYSMQLKTLAGIRAGYADGLVGRAATSCSKKAANWCWCRVKCRLANPSRKYARTFAHGCGDGAAVPAFYNHPETVDDIVHHVVAACWINLASNILTPGAGKDCRGPEFFSGE